MMYSLAQLMAYSTHTLVNNNLADLGLLVGQQTYIDRAREDLALMALYPEGEWSGVTHILWIDDDMIFPKDSLVRLLSRKLDCVGANYPKRGVPCTFNAAKSLGITNGGEKVYCETTKDSSGVEEVEGLGFGLVLVKADAFREMKRPWFSTHYNMEKRWYIGEDIDFCMKYRDTGRTIHVDHDLTKEVLHVGWYEYGYEAAQAWQEIEKGRLGEHHQLH